MEFRKEVEVAKVLIGGKIEDSVVEIRYDPLTLQTSRVVKKSLSIFKSENFDEEIESTKNFCPFCEERLDTMVARDPEIMGGEIWKRGESRAFSNLIPYAKYSIVIRISEKHFLKLSEFKESQFFDAFKLVQEYIKRLPNKKFFITIGMNYLKSAGSSIMHPHIQFIATENSPDYFARLEWSSLEFMEANGKDFWLALVEKEREGERYVGRTEKTEWISAFAPKGFMHFIGIPEEREFAEMSDEQLMGFAKGIIKILRYYESKGFNAFNFSFFCADRLDKHFRTNFHIVARTPFGKYYWCDVFFPKMFQDESIVFFSPEDYARELREIW
uniref:Galactose-1-phosphate uridylyltransferase n=1 Tax=Archaeoglobus fulgidus TaxID=2234 RepID=A0A7J2TJJ3_ARCFL